MSINLAAFMTDVKRIEVREVPMPDIKADEILLKVEYVGVCGSDVHFFETGIRKGEKFDLPFILGHECAGTVVDVGKNVHNVKSGDRICFEPQITCGLCEYCRSGRYNMCPDVVFPSVPPTHGLLQNYVAIPAYLAFRLPENVSTLEGALMEPLCVGLAASQRGGVSLEKSTVILGSGCIGLMTLLAAKAMGAGYTIVSDLYENRLQMALSLGADAVINAAEEQMMDKALEQLSGQGADIVFETAGNKKTAALTTDLIRRGGVIVLVGNIGGETPYRFMDLMYKEAEIRPIYRYRNLFPTAIQMVASKKIKLDSIVSHTYAFEDVQKAFIKASEDKQNVIKAVIRM